MIDLVHYVDDDEIAALESESAPERVSISPYEETPKTPGTHRKKKCK